MQRRCTPFAAGRWTAFLLVLLLAVPALLPYGASSLPHQTGRALPPFEYPFPHGGGNSTNFPLVVPSGSFITNLSLLLRGGAVDTEGVWNATDAAGFSTGGFNGTVFSRVDGGVRLRESATWWNSSWRYRVRVEVNSSGKDRDAITVFTPVNGTSLLFSVGAAGQPFEPASLRAVEVDSDGNPVVFNGSIAGDGRFEVPTQFVPSPAYNRTSNATGTLHFLLGGPTPANTTRRYDVYFDTADRPKPASRYALLDYMDFATAYYNAGYSGLFFGKKGSIGPSADASVTTQFASDMEVADLNRDGYTDIIVDVRRSTSFYDSSGFIYYGSRDGYKPANSKRFPASGSWGVDVYDVNRDSWPDLIVANSRTGSYPGSGNRNFASTIFLGGPAGFNSTPDFNLSTVGAMEAAEGDFDRDGDIDIAFANIRDNSGNYAINSYVYYFNSTAGTFDPSPALLPTVGADEVATADLNRDGWPDLVFGSYNNAAGGPVTSNRIYYGSPSGFNTPGVDLPTRAANQIVIADVNYDDWPDIIVAEENDGTWGGVITNSTIFLGSPSGYDTGRTITLLTVQAYGVQAADMNRDGLTDILFTNYQGTSTIFLGNGTDFNRSGAISLGTEAGTRSSVGELSEYTMATDRDPPALSVSSPQAGRFLATGVYLTPAVPVDGINSITAFWNSTAPAGTVIAVGASADGGTAWQPLASGTATPLQPPPRGGAFAGRVQMYGNTRESPVLPDISFHYSASSLPSNLTLDAGRDGTVEWSYNGSLSGTVYLNDSTALIAALNRLIPARPGGNATVNITFASDTAGQLNVSLAGLAYDFRPEILQPLPPVSFDEDATLMYAFNLSAHFRDPEGKTLDFTSSGNGSIRPAISSNGSVSFTADRDYFGTENITFRAARPTGSFSELSTMVTVTPVNDGPVAVINASANATDSLVPVRFDGSASYDIDGTIVVYEWDFGDGTQGGGVAASHTFSNGNATYTVRLTVRDNASAVGRLEVNITVANLPPSASLQASASEVSTNVPVTLIASGSADRDGRIAGYLFDFGDGEDSGWLNSTTATHSFRKPGNYTVSLTVMDDDGALVITNITVKVRNRAPVISKLIAKSEVNVGDTVSIQAEANDTDGTIVRYDWDFDGDGVIDATSDKPSQFYRFKKAGAYTVTVTVVDDAGDTASSTMVMNVVAPQGPGGVLSNPLALLASVVVVAVAAVGAGVFLLRRRGAPQQPAAPGMAPTRLPDEFAEAAAAGMTAAGQTGPPPAPPAEGGFEEEAGAPAIPPPPAPPAGPEGFEEVPPPTGELAAPPEPPREEATAAHAGTGKPAVEVQALLDSLGGSSPKPSASPPAEGGFEEVAPPPPAPSSPKPVTPALPVKEEGGFEEVPSPAPAPSAPAEGGFEEVPPQAAPAVPSPVTPPAPPQQPAPAAPQPPVPPVPAPEATAPAAPPAVEKKPLAKARCPACKGAIPIYETTRPLKITCPSCGKVGMIK